MPAQPGRFGLRQPAGQPPPERRRAGRQGPISKRLAAFKHPLLGRLSFVDAYEGKSIPAGKRGLTFRAEIGAEDRTLGDDDVRAFQEAFKAFLASAGMELRS